MDKDVDTSVSQGALKIVLPGNGVRKHLFV